MNEKLALNWIDGEWIDASDHKESIDPATYAVIGRYAVVASEIDAWFWHEGREAIDCSTHVAKCL